MVIADDNLPVKTLCATYRIRSNVSPKAVAEAIAMEQSSGLPDSHRLKINWGRASVTSVNEVVSASKKPHVADRVGNIQRYYEIQVQYQLRDQSHCMPELLNVVVGEVHHLTCCNAIRLIRINMSSDVAANWKGPSLGISGVRQKTGIQSRPIIIAPVKPSIGLNNDEFVHAAREALLGGADIVKDDELLVTDPSSALDRTRRMVGALKEVEDITGRRKMYVVNIFGILHHSRERLNVLVGSGLGEHSNLGVMICPHWSSFCAIEELTGELASLQWPIVCHNSGFTTMSGPKDTGISLGTLVGLQRLAGADIIIVPSPYGSFEIEEDEVKACYSASTSTALPIKRSLLAMAGKKNPSNIGATLDLTGSPDSALVIGSGIYGHEDGPGSGAKECLASVEAWVAQK